MALIRCGGGNNATPTYVDGVQHTRVAEGEATIKTMNISTTETLYFAIQVLNNATSAYTSVCVNGTEVSRVTSPGANQNGFGILSADVTNGDVVTIKTWGNSSSHRTDTTCIIFTV